MQFLENPGWRVALFVVPVVTVFVGITIKYPQHLEPPHVYDMQDMQVDIKQCKDAGFEYKPMLSYGGRAGDGQEVYGIECVLPNNGGTIRADAHTKTKDPK